MSKKDFDNYVIKISKQYSDYKNILETISKEAQETMLDPDYMNRLEEQVLPLKQNYERVMYIKFLLDQPTRKKKINKYKQTLRSFENQLNNKNTTNAVIQENQTIIDKLREE